MAEIGPSYLEGQSKRTLDVIGSIALAPALLPLAATVGVTSAIDTRNNPFFHQTRVGKNVQPYELIKFRTLATRPEAEYENLGVDDPRASAVGRIIRRTGLDEIPQFMDVLRGEMSLVGRRPFVEDDPELDIMSSSDPRLFDEWVDDPFRPGLTGLSQLYRHSMRDSRERNVLIQTMIIDIKYRETASLRKDLEILGLTPLKMLKAAIRPINNVQDLAEVETTIAPSAGQVMRAPTA